MGLEKAIYTDNLYALGCQGLIMVHGKKGTNKKPFLSFMRLVGSDPIEGARN